MPVFSSEVSTDGRTEYSTSHRTPEDSGSPHTDIGECGSADAIPGAGNYGRRRNLLRRKCNLSQLNHVQ